MLLRDIYIFLWTLPSIGILLLSILSMDYTFIGGAAILSIFLLIPVIIKGYQYHMIPFILAETPLTESGVAFNMTKEMTNGFKLDLFILDLSFILWHIFLYFPNE